MKGRTRARIMWILAASAAAFGMLSVATFYFTNTFGPTWLLLSMVIYGAILVTALALAVVDRGAPIQETTIVARLQGEPKLLERVVTYRTKGGMAVRLVYLWPDGQREVRHSAFTPTEALQLHDIEVQVDALPPVPEPPRMDDEIDVVLRRWTANEWPGASR